MQRQLVILLVLLNCIGSIYSRVDITSYKSRVPWPLLRLDKAAAICNHLGSYLTNPDPLVDYIQSYSLEGTTLPPLWLPIRRHYFGNVTTVDGDKYEGFLGQPGTEVEGMDCGVFHAQDKLFADKPCNSRTDAFICQFKNREDCPEGLECYSISGDILAFIHRRSTWFEAHDQCKEDGGKLVSLTPEMAEELVQFVSDHKEINSHYLIGLIRSGWISVNSNGTAILPSYKWGQDQPDPSRHKNCAIVKFSKGLVSWRAVSCNEEFHFFCHSDILQHDIRGTKSSSVSSQQRRANISSGNVSHQNNKEWPDVMSKEACTHPGQQFTIQHWLIVCLALMTSCFFLIICLLLIVWYLILKLPQKLTRESAQTSNQNTGDNVQTEEMRAFLKHEEKQEEKTSHEITEGNHSCTQNKESEPEEGNTPDHSHDGGQANPMAKTLHSRQKYRQPVPVH